MLHFLMDKTNYFQMTHTRSVQMGGSSPTPMWEQEVKLERDALDPCLERGVETEKLHGFQISVLEVAQATCSQ